MKLIIGLGNHEPKYNLTRHNVGFWCVDTYAHAHDLSWKHSDKFRADIAEFTQEGEKVLVAKPTTFYNLVGESARSVADFYKIEPDDILIIHDDLALPLGTIRTRRAGSDGGNNGLKSLQAHLGPDTYRLRVGIWTDVHERADKVDVVLGKLNREEQAILNRQVETIRNLIDGFIAERLVVTTHRAEAIE